MSFASKYVDEFLSGMGTSGITLYNRVIGQVRDMDENEIGLTPGAYNARIVDDIAGTMIDFFDSPTYENRLTKLENSLVKIASDVVSSEMKKQDQDTTPELVEQVQNTLEQYQYALNGVLQDEAVEYNILTPFVNDAFLLIGRGASIESMETLTRKLQDSFYNYFITKVTTLIEQFEREIYSIVADNFSVERFIYYGPDDKVCREFCSANVDHVYTWEQIENMEFRGMDINGTWDGMIPGTNGSNMFVNLGGYNCRHVLQPYKK